MSEGRRAFYEGGSQEESIRKKIVVFLFAFFFCCFFFLVSKFGKSSSPSFRQYAAQTPQYQQYGHIFGPRALLLPFLPLS